MNYEQKYKEALETVQEILSSGADAIRIKTLKLRLQSVFPELAESEDERIRQELIEHIKANYEADYVLFKKFSPDDVIAWLEKQGERRSLDVDKVIKWIDEHMPTKFEDMENYVKDFKQDFGLC